MNVVPSVPVPDTTKTKDPYKVIVGGITFLGLVCVSVWAIMRSRFLYRESVQRAIAAQQGQIGFLASLPFAGMLFERVSIPSITGGATSETTAASSADPWEE